MSAPDLSQVYAERRRLAAVKMAGQPDAHTLDVTALVHEAFLKLDGESFASRFAYQRVTAVAIRRMRADKRGGGRRTDFEPARLPDAEEDDAAAVGDALGISLRTADRLRVYAKARLFRRRLRQCVQPPTEVRP